jgi:hypothetical protein
MTKQKPEARDEEVEDNNEEADEETSDESAESPAAQAVPPGKEPLPATAKEFADAVLSRKPG